QLAKMIGAPVNLHGALVRDLSRQRAATLPDGALTTSADDILGNPAVDIVVEVMGGEQPALDYILKSISLGKHVVTANKEVMAKHGAKILTQARENGVQVLFEASVAGGTPIIAPLLRDLVANDVVSINGIINGTTNYILTKMAQEGQDFGVALSEAQDLGYAEADPTNDIEGIDAAYKLAVLSTLAFRARVTDVDVYSEGITHLTAQDFRYASELGYAIKLLAIASKTDGAVHVRVHPAMVPSEVMLAKVDGVLNAIEVQTDLAGRVLFHGRGAGDMPTTSAVLADVVHIARNLVSEVDAPPLPALNADVHISPMDALETKYYMRMNVIERPGVFAQILKVLGDLDISIASAIQKETDDAARRAEIVLMTHRAKEESVQTALQAIDKLEVVNEIGSLIRVEEWD
ncbi:MAG: homoserine dehydrogenase, partial [Chloroflexi bacterium]|nr:homoserine dehydrogenase [Chloroflexota bacterium]